MSTIRRSHLPLLAQVLATAYCRRTAFKLFRIMCLTVRFTFLDCFETAGEYRFTVVEDELQPINAPFKDPRAELRAAVESRFLSMRLHATKLGLVRPTAVVATGGASASTAILQVNRG